MPFSHPPKSHLPRLSLPQSHLPSLISPASSPQPQFPSLSSHPITSPSSLFSLIPHHSPGSGRRRRCHPVGCQGWAPQGKVSRVEDPPGTQYTRWHSAGSPPWASAGSDCYMSASSGSQKPRLPVGVEKKVPRLLQVT